MDEAGLYRAFGSTVAKRRKSLSLTQAGVAALTGMTRSALANIETGRQKVLLHQVVLLANALELEGIGPLLVGRVSPSSPSAPSRPIDDAEVTPLQRSQLEGAIADALIEGGHLERSTG